MLVSISTHLKAKREAHPRDTPRTERRKDAQRQGWECSKVNRCVAHHPPLVPRCPIFPPRRLFLGRYRCRYRSRCCCRLRVFGIEVVDGLQHRYRLFARKWCSTRETTQRQNVSLAQNVTTEMTGSVTIYQSKLLLDSHDSYEGIRRVSRKNTSGAQEKRAWRLQRRPFSSEATAMGGRNSMHPGSYAEDAWVQIIWVLGAPKGQPISYLGRGILCIASGRVSSVRTLTFGASRTSGEGPLGSRSLGSAVE